MPAIYKYMFWMGNCLKGAISTPLARFPPSCVYNFWGFAKFKAELFPDR